MGEAGGSAAAWAGGVALLGLIAGSFLSTLAIRWPQGRSVVRGRSACDGCGRTLRAAELVPVASFLAARGRCGACGRRIDPRHLWFELGCAAIGASAGWIAASPLALAGASFGWLLLTLAAIDAAEFWLPDPLVALLAGGGLAGAYWFPAPVDRLIGGAAGFVSLWLIAFAYRRVRGRAGLGGGDPKLFGAIGLWLGWRMLPAVLMIAGLVGLGLVAVRLAGGRAVARDDALPLGTFLAAAAYPAWLAMVGWGG